MKARLRKRSPALVVATVALVVVLGATAGVFGTASPAGPAALAWGVEDITLAPGIPAQARGVPGLRRGTSTWCGTATAKDLVPNAVAGAFSHWIYAIASDAPDNSATFASLMQTDAEIIDGWYRASDPTRTSRNDLAQFPCGQQIDLSIVRLPQSMAQLAVDATRFVLIANTLATSGFGSNYGKYFVYYDGPANEVNLCGQGGSLQTGLGYAITYVQSCAGVPFNTVAAHEGLHTYGAVPVGAPHACPTTPGHVCDDPYDIMFPFADETPLTGLILDVNRDDYYGHSGAWLDIQDSPWLIQLDRQTPMTLTITGKGQVVSDVPGLLCASTCTTTWNRDTRLVLNAVADPGSKLVRWSGPCSGNSPSCGLGVAAGVAPSVLFAPSTYTLGVAVAGKGTVRSARVGIACPGKCTAAFPSYVPVVLTAKSAKGYRFKSWAGACKGTKPTCKVPMTANSKARATFVRS